LLFLVASFGFLGCQQTQEDADDADGGTTVIEEDVDIEPAPDPADVQMDVDVEGEGGVSGEVETN
jgi:hypothetical protein